MKKLAFLLTIMTSYVLSAFGEITATGQFVVAPIVSDKCVTSATTMPTSGLSTESQLFKGLTYLLSSENKYPTAIKEVKQTAAANNSAISGIYTLEGRKISTLQQGVNIIVHTDGSISKVMK